MSFFEWLKSFGKNKANKSVPKNEDCDSKTVEIKQIEDNPGKTKIDNSAGNTSPKSTGIEINTGKNIQSNQPKYNNNEKPLTTLRQENTLNAILIAKSGKGGGACVAAYSFDQRKIVRFVSNPNTGAEIPFSDLRNIEELDIVEVENLHICPIKHQTENILVKRNGIKKIGHYNGTIEDIRKDVLYPDKESITRTTTDNIRNIEGLNHSLEIICVKDLHIYKASAANGKTTTRANFSYAGKEHKNYRVTDFNYDLRKSETASIFFPYADLVLSIPKETYIYNGTDFGYYKFVAAIFPIEIPKKDSVIKRSKKKENCASIDDLTKNAYEPWSPTEDEKLKDEFRQGFSINKMSELHGRTNGAIEARLKKLGMEK